VLCIFKYDMTVAVIHQIEDDLVNTCILPLVHRKGIHVTIVVIKAIFDSMSICIRGFVVHVLMGYHLQMSVSVIVMVSVSTIIPGILICKESVKF